MLSKLKEFSSRPAFASGDRTESYAELQALVQTAVAALALRGLSRGSAVGIISSHSPAGTAWVLACAAAGCVAVPLSGNPAEHAARLKIASVRLVVHCQWDAWTVVEGPGGTMPPLLAQLAAKGRAGLVLFSSGTSGEPKAMVHDLNTLLATYSDRKPRNLPVCVLLGFDHIGGLHTLFGALSSGSLVIVPSDTSVAVVARAIAQHKAAILPASPTFLNLLLVSGELTQHDLSSLRIVSYGTEPMPESVLSRLQTAFPNAKLLQTFGTSETGIARTESPIGNSLYMKMDDPHLQWKVVDGELWLKSETQVLGYLNASMERFTADGWFRTGDRAEVGPDHTVRIFGRTGELINVGGEKVLPVEVESVVLTVPGVDDCRARGEVSALTGQTVVVDVVAHAGVDQEALKAAIRTACRAVLAKHKVPTKVSFVEKVAGERGKKVRQQVE
jgi:acyl-coenzyme A synthetase/AMP-(fatty) acid ligase